MNDLIEAINAAWVAAYPGEPAVTEIPKLCNRVKQLGVDRANWISNAKALQKDSTKLATAMRVADGLANALEQLLSRDQVRTCRHEETSRGGVLWEICDRCGMKWADDEGGKPKFEEPTEWTWAEAAIASAKALQKDNEQLRSKKS